MELHAKVTLFAEGARGSLTKKLFEKFKLREGVDPQSFGIGLKEVWFLFYLLFNEQVWEIPPEKHKPGLVVHTAGWPVDLTTWGGFFSFSYIVFM